MKLPWYLKQVDKPYEDEEGWHMEIKFTWLGWLWFKWKMKRIPGGTLIMNITSGDGSDIIIEDEKDEAE